MSKKSFKGGAMLNPVPAVMVSCGSSKPNIITIAWTGIVNSNPPMTYISVRKERYSHSIIKNTGEFVINLCNEQLAFATDYCGVRSGRDIDKFKEMKLTSEKAEIVRCPMIKESPVNIECRVREVIELGSHDMFLADIIKVHVDEEYIDENNRIRLDRAALVAYNHGEYFGLKRQPLGRFGFSVMKPKTRKRLNREKQGKNRRTGIKKSK